MNRGEFSKSIVLLLVVICIGMAAHAQTPTNCSYYSTTLGPFPYGNFNTLEHVSGSGSHQFANSMNGSCTYTGTGSPYGAVGCSVTAKANSRSGASDTGTLVNPLKSHHTNYKDAQGLATANYGGPASADAEGAAAVQSCIGSCSTTIGLSGSGQGTGFSLSFTPTPLWEDSQHYTNNCAGRTLQQVASSCLSPNPPFPPYTPPPTGDTWQWDPINCLWYLEDTNPSPIVIDTTNTGFVFTDPAKGNYVTFDMRGDGNYEKLSWPKSGSGNAWLVYDRDGDGIIKDGTELFGNFTPHSDGGVANNKDANGFLALEWYDQPAQGGNYDLLIDKNDAIWQKLRVWIDGHCYLNPDAPCQSLPSELYTLESKSINSLSLVYGYSTKADAIGNQFKFAAVVNPEAETTPKDSQGNSCCDLHQQSKDGRLMYDVFLKRVQ